MNIEFLSGGKAIPPRWAVLLVAPVLALVSGCVPLQNPKVYVSGQDQYYHDANCTQAPSSLTGYSREKVLELGYLPCDHCFGPPVQEAPSVSLRYEETVVVHRSLAIDATGEFPESFDEGQYELEAYPSIAPPGPRSIQGSVPVQASLQPNGSTGFVRSTPRVNLQEIVQVSSKDVDYHRVDCKSVDGVRRSIPLGSAINQGFGWCETCQPTKVNSAYTGTKTQETPYVRRQREMREENQARSDTLKAPEPTDRRAVQNRRLTTQPRTIR